jgi:uncharacterized protein (DUF433 family)
LRNSKLDFSAPACFEPLKAKGFSKTLRYNHQHTKQEQHWMSETQAYNVTAAHITQTPGVCGGKPCIAGRRIRVQDVYEWHEKLGMSAAKIASEYNLSLAQVHAALTFAFDHLEEILADIEASEHNVESFKRDYPDQVKKLPGE